MAGSAKGRILKVPAAGTRPTSARIREALFSKLEHWNMVEDARVLDLYAGSGALGLEALSRGAAHCTFVDQARAALDTVKQNAKATDLRAQSSYHLGDASAFLTQLSARRTERPGGNRGNWSAETPVAVTARTENTAVRTPATGSAVDPAPAYDLVFVDPPYAFTPRQIHEIAGLLVPHLESHSVLVVERAAVATILELPEMLEVFDERQWGNTRCWFVQLLTERPN